MARVGALPVVEGEEPVGSSEPPVDPETRESGSVSVTPGGTRWNPQTACDAYPVTVDVDRQSVERCQVLAHPPRNEPWGEHDRAELGLEFCPGLIERYPATAVPVHRLLRLGEAEALFVLARPEGAVEVYEALLETDSTDAHIYAGWRNVDRRGCPPAGKPADEETEQSARSGGSDRGRDEDPPPA